MLVQGTVIAENIYRTLLKEVALLPGVPRLGILTCAPTFETEKYLALKERKARDIGIETEVVRVAGDASTEYLVDELSSLTERTDGVVVQLPLPPHIDTSTVLASIPSSHDVDALNPETVDILSPVVGAIAEIIKVHEVPVLNRHVTVIGSGKLVGLPASRWFMERGASVSIVTRDTLDIAFYTKTADIIVSGAGVPGLLSPEMIKEGVVIFDAGTSEDGGMLRGDAQEQCSLKSSLFTPVPGGIGPITIAVLLRNVVRFAQSK
jgi:methylenetetrahydrofolate dehydrogenase (NADP+) / methenyltetrahydrofolate cyclohydrolase